MLAGTTEGTVFAFRLRDPSNTGEGTPGTDSRTESDVWNSVSHPADGHAELGVVVMKFQHTRRSIERVSCSREQVRFCSQRLRMVFVALYATTSGHRLLDSLGGAPYACRHWFFSRKRSTGSAPVDCMPRSCDVVRR